MTGETEKESPEGAIDADFEPAPAADYVLPKNPSPHSGPGWPLFALVSAISVAALGLSSYTFSQNSAAAPGEVPSDIAERIDTLESAQGTNAADIKSVRESVAASETRMASEIEALLSGGENGEGLEALVAELETVSKRLDDAMAGSGDSDALKSIELRLSALGRYW